jgi:hypothetical protein
VWEFRLTVYDTTGNCLFQDIFKSSTEAGDSRIDRGGYHTQKTSHELRECYKATYNPQTRIYGTDIKVILNSSGKVQVNIDNQSGMIIIRLYKSRVERSKP